MLFQNFMLAPQLSFSTQTRVRLSFKRRPPTRQHRRSAGEEKTGALEIALSPCELDGPEENGDKDQLFDSPEEEVKCGLPAGLKETEAKDMDCEKTEDEVAKDEADDKRDLEEEQEAEQAQSLETLEEDQQPSEPQPANQTEEQEEMAQVEHQ